MAPPTILYPRLSGQRYKLLDEIQEFWRDNGYAPTARELTEKMGYASVSTVHVHLVILREQGMVEWAERKPRTLRVTPRGDGAMIEQRAIVTR